MNKTLIVCSKCGKTAEYSVALANGWLVHQREGAPQGHLVIRCPDHITQHTRRAAGLPQQERTRKVADNVERGLWAEYGAAEDNYIAAAGMQHPDHDSDGYYYITYHHGRMPAFDTETFDTIPQLIAAMRKLEPDLRKWKLTEG